MGIKIRRVFYNLSLLLASSILLSSTQVGLAHALSGAYPAGDEIGQYSSGNPIFTTDAVNNNQSPIDGSVLNEPAGTALDTVHHRLFVADLGNNRILVFNLDSQNNLQSHTANNVLGQSSMSTSGHGAGQNQLYGPVGPSYDADHNRLFVNDVYNNRLMIWDLSDGITDGMNAMSEFGQADWGQGRYNRGGSVDANTLGYNWGDTAYDKAHNWLYTEDDGNNRVLIYDLSGGITKGQNALYVLGQTAVDDSSNYSTTQSTFKDPYSLVYDNVHQRLFVGDYTNNRVMGFDMSGAVTIENGMQASWVLGQTGFSSSGAHLDAGSVTNPIGFAYDSTTNRLFVADDSQYRIMVFDVSTITNDNQYAVAVIGTDSFTTGNPQSPCTPTQTSICDAENSMSFDPVNNRLYVPDLSNQRLMIFNFAHVTTLAGAITAGTTNSNYNFSFPTSDGQCTVSYSKTGGSLPPGLSLSSAGKISGKPTSIGKYDFEISVTDDCGVLGTFIQDPAYSITVTAGAPNTGFGQQSSSNLLSLSLVMVGLISLTYSVRKRRA